MTIPCNMLVMLMTDPDYDRFFVQGARRRLSGLIKGYLQLCASDHVPFGGVRVTISPRTIPNEDADEFIYGSSTVELVTDEEGKVDYTFLKGAIVDVHIERFNLFRTIVVPNIGEEFDILKAKTA